MVKQHILTDYCAGIKELSVFLKRIHPDDIIAITQRVGYTVVYKSNSEFSWKYRR